MLEIKDLSSSLASWLPFLQDMQALASKKSDLSTSMLQDNPWATVPQIGRVTRSWDFVPPEVVRPLASSMRVDSLIDVWLT